MPNIGRLREYISGRVSSIGFTTLAIVAMGGSSVGGVVFGAAIGADIAITVFSECILFLVSAFLIYYRNNIVGLLWLVWAQADGDCKHGPPVAADYLLHLFLSRHNRRQIIGDLTEEFHEDVLPRFGMKAARFWYWKKALSAIVERNPITRGILVGGGLLKVGAWIWKKFAG